MTKKNLIGSDLTDFFDSYLLSSGKKELTLKTANQLLKLEERFEGIELKQLLEEGKVTQAYQTEISPRQWYIKFSRPEEYRKLRKEYLQINRVPNEVEVSKENNLLSDLEVVGTGLNKLKDNWNLKIIAGAIVIIGVAIFFVKTPSGKSFSETNKYYTKDGFYYAVSKDAFDRMGDYFVSKDEAALNTLIQNGEIVTLPEGVEVNVEGYYLAYMVVRPQGETYKLWCVSEAIARK